MGGYPLFNGNYNETSVFNYAWTWTWVQVGFQWVVVGGSWAGGERGLPVTPWHLQLNARPSA